MDLEKSLIENDSIVLNVETKDWEDAIQQSVNPLIKSKAVTQQYVEEIIHSTNELGAYYVLLPNFAMAHARPGDYVKKNAFSLITLKEPVNFPNDIPVKVIVCLAATNSDKHLETALPQIAAIFSDERIIEEIYQLKTKEDLLNFIRERNGYTCQK